MGVFPRSLCDLKAEGGLPHARGGVSQTSAEHRAAWRSSPRSWGCFYHAVCTRQNPGGLPHARGGVSGVVGSPFVNLWSSPRSWGCFSHRHRVRQNISGLPHARGGVSWLSACRKKRDGSLPHARGGVSMYITSLEITRESSPRSWGCFQIAPYSPGPRFVFPTLVGVFPRAFGLLPTMRASSPRSWGCFLGSPAMRAKYFVFPTLVGVFPYKFKSITNRGGLPHARGGVSGYAETDQTRRQSSPRSWGCFRYNLVHRGENRVFPTLVGVFLK